MDIDRVLHYPHTHHMNHLMSATAKLKVEVSALHAGQNGRLEISCRATIPDFPMHHEKFADIKVRTVSGKFLIFSIDIKLFPRGNVVTIFDNRCRIFENKQETSHKNKSRIIFLKGSTLSGNKEKNTHAFSLRSWLLSRSLVTLYLRVCLLLALGLP